MSKSITNQRKVFKIHSGRFRNNNWILKLNLKEASENEEVVSLGDSNLLRIIREIRGGTIDEEINKIKQEILQIEKMDNSKKNRRKIKEYQSKLDELSFTDDYLLIIFDSDKDWDFINSKKTKLFLNENEYVRLVGTNGGIKKNVVVFCKQELHEELNIRLNNGRNEKKKYVAGKFESYKALACSASTPVTTPKKLLVIKDGETIFTDKVLQLSDDKKGGFNLKEVEKYQINRAFTDGCGMISENLSKQWAKDLNAERRGRCHSECHPAGGLFYRRKNNDLDALAHDARYHSRTFAEYPSLAPLRTGSKSGADGGILFTGRGYSR
jgi:hypothetical protein